MAPELPARAVRAFSVRDEWGQFAPEILPAISRYLASTMAHPTARLIPTSDDVLTALAADADALVARLFTDLAAGYFESSAARDGPVSTPHTARELAERFDEPLPRRGQPIEAVVARLCNEVIPDCNHLCHPRYMGHQVSAPLPAAVWTEALAAALNQSVAVWEMSPVATVLEHRVVRWMCDLAGFGPDSGGTLTSGGTEATFTALLAARSVVMPDVWTQGVGSGQVPVVVCGEHTHYAVTRAVGEMGLGMSSVVTIPSLDWRMDTGALRAALDDVASRGRSVMAVVATAGSTATGSFDDLETIGALCDERELWLHVDGAHGASALLSETHRGSVRGLSRARSIAWDPHKMMLMPLSAGVLLMRDERDLDGAFAQRAPYLFHAGTDDQRVWDQGPHSFLCSRRADVLKLWVALQRYGADGIGALYDRLCSLARWMHDQIVLRDDFSVLHVPQCNILCFRYVGTGLLAAVQLDNLNRELRERYNRSGDGWITTTILGGQRVLRVTLMNPRTDESDIRAVLDGLAELGSELEAAV